MTIQQHAEECGGRLVLAGKRKLECMTCSYGFKGLRSYKKRAPGDTGIRRPRQLRRQPLYALSGW